MTREEHLAAIVAKCRELLELSWGVNGYAQAGWQATIAAIEGLMSAESLIYSVQNDYDESPPKWWRGRRDCVIEAQNQILAAWPVELLS